MRKMGISPEMRLTEALEYFPQTFPMFRQLGMCCVNEENAEWTVEELCARYGVNAASFLEVVNNAL